MTENEDVLNQLTPEEQMELQQFLQSNPSGPLPAESYNAHKFLYDVSISKDTTKTGYLTKEELGEPQLPLRSLKELALFCRKIWKQPIFAEFFEAQAEILTASSLSKEAKLIDLVATTKRQLEDVTKASKKENKGWFKKKGGNE